MIEKRKLVFIALMTIVWASIASGIAAYYYLEQTRYQDKMRELTRNYDTSVTKWNLLSGDYASLLGEYQFFENEDHHPLMHKYDDLLSNLKNNYTTTLSESPELNETYNGLSSNFQTLNNASVVTKEEFASLLDDFYKLLTAIAMKEQGESAGEIGVIHVSLCVDYGNQTIKWYNSTSTPSGTTLFDLTRKIANVKYSYWPAMEPGHMLVTSINNHAEGYWIWYYWDETKGDWVFGPFGCDAWILKDNGIYKWTCFS